MLPCIKVSSIALHIWDMWVKHFGFPRSIRSEMGPDFEMALWFALCRIAGTYKTFEHHPNLRLPEKFHRAVTSLIDQYGIWQSPHPTMFLSSAFFAYNTKIHYGMGESPFKAFQGRSATVPDDLVFPELGEPAEDEATQLQDTEARFQVFYGKMQGMFHGIPLLTDHLWRIYELVWFHTP